MNETLSRRHLRLPGTHNVRDVGGYPTLDGGRTRWRTFLRADSLHRLTPTAQQELLAQGVRTVIDLRFELECETAPNVFANSPQVRYVHIPLLADLIKQGGRPLATPDVIYRRAIDSCHARIKQVFDVLTAANGLPVLVHCTAGKDRTGIIAALVLASANVDAETIADDYALTANVADALFAELRTAAAVAGQDSAQVEQMLTAKPEAILHLLEYIDAKYGGIIRYLRFIGVSHEQLAELRRQMVEPADADYISLPSSMEHAVLWAQ